MQDDVFIFDQGILDFIHCGSSSTGSVGKPIAKADPHEVGVDFVREGSHQEAFPGAGRPGDQGKQAGLGGEIGKIACEVETGEFR